MKCTYWVVCFTLISLTACKNDDSLTKPFMGHWDLTYGELNGQAAPSFEKVFFEFGLDSIKTNFTLSEQEESGTYEIKENKLIQNTAQPIEYEIVSKTDSTLEIITALRGLDFKLILKKRS